MTTYDPTQPERQEMVTRQIEHRGVKDELVLKAMRSVPRHRFVPDGLRSQAYQDGPLPIGQGQTISQPYIVAEMTALLALRGGENVLEIGTGSGYQAAVLAQIARTVHSVERVAALAEKAQMVLDDLEIRNVFVHRSDGSLGWPEAALYDGILVTAAAPAPPPALLEQLAPGGHLVLPVGGPQGQVLQRWHRKGNAYQIESIFEVAFVPLRGVAGWREEEWQDRNGSD